jgi:hypothetical protein
MIKNDNINSNNNADANLQIVHEENGFIEQKLDDINSKPKRNFNVLKKSINTNNLNNLILSCVKNDEYCYTMLDYFKKVFHFSQIDYYSAYSQILYCFKPREM